MKTEISAFCVRCKKSGGNSCKPDSVLPLRKAATICLCDQYPGFKRREQRLTPYLVLLQEGFTTRRGSLPVPVGSYPAFSPLPGLHRAVCFLLHSPSGRISLPHPFHQGTPCSVESGLSSGPERPAAARCLLKGGNILLHSGKFHCCHANICKREIRLVAEKVFYPLTPSIFEASTAASLPPPSIRLISRTLPGRSS